MTWRFYAPFGDFTKETWRFFGGDFLGDFMEE
jgi:hypothetical protein